MRRAAARVEKYLRDTYDGATHSSNQPAVYRGYWYDDNLKLWIDEIEVLFADLDRKTYYGADLDHATDEIEHVARTAYDARGVHQEVFWITVTELEVT